MKFFLLGLLLAAQSVIAAQPVTLKASDGLRIHAEYYPAAANDKPIILLFHRAGLSQTEYDTIIPKLTQLGFSALAVDQRQMPYIAALNDLDAALAWAKGNGHAGNIIIWGSSYSAALVFLLAAEHPNDIKALLAFSPSEYLDESDRVKQAAAKVTCPVFIDSAKDPEEIAHAKAILNAVASTNKTQFEPSTAGIHGSATLRSDHNPKGADENWRAVDQFLAQLH